MKPAAGFRWLHCLEPAENRNFSLKTASGSRPYGLVLLLGAMCYGSRAGYTSTLSVLGWPFGMVWKQNPFLPLEILFLTLNVFFAATMQSVAVISSWSVHAISVWNWHNLKFSIMRQKFSSLEDHFNFIPSSCVQSKDRFTIKKLCRPAFCLYAMEGKKFSPFSQCEPSWKVVLTDVVHQVRTRAVYLNLDLFSVAAAASNLPSCFNLIYHVSCSSSAGALRLKFLPLVSRWVLSGYAFQLWFDECLGLLGRAGRSFPSSNLVNWRSCLDKFYSYGFLPYCNAIEQTISDPSLSPRKIRFKARRLASVPSAQSLIQINPDAFQRWFSVWNNSTKLTTSMMDHNCYMLFWSGLGCGHFLFAVCL